MKKMVFASAVLGACLWAQAAVAAGPTAASTLIGAFGDWKAYSFMDGKDKVCFISGHPRKQEGKYKKRNEVQFFVTRWTGNAESNVVSVSIGYGFKLDSSAAVTLDGQSFQLSTQGEMAWSKGQAMDDAIVAALQKGGSMKVEGTSARGNKSVDTYDLTGAADAYKAFDGACAKK